MMNPGVPVAFLQLKKQPRRLLIALAGIAVSSVGIVCQMGFEDSLFRSATRLFQEFEADLVVISPQYQFMVLPAQFSERRLYQSLAVKDVESFTSIHLGIAPFKNPQTHIHRNVYVVGVGRTGRAFSNPVWENKVRALQSPQDMLFDAKSRPEFGPIADLVRAQPIETEISNRSVRIVDLFDMGASFSADGTVLATDEGFARLFPSRRTGLVDLGLIHLKPNADPQAVVSELRALLPQDVDVITHAALNEREQAYWRSTTPAGFIFRTVMIVSILVGCVSVYQILSSDIAENLKQYATLKALGYPDSYFAKLTFEKAWLLTSMGYPVGFALAYFVYIAATHLTLVPLVMTSARAIGVYLLVLGASAAAGLIAINRLRRVDLSELF